jgi:hypothetical protein
MPAVTAPRRVAPLAAALVATLAVGAGSTSGAAAWPEVRTRALAFSTLWRSNGEGTGKLPYTTAQKLDGAYVIGRITDAHRMSPTLISQAHLAQLDRFDWRKRFVLIVSIVRPTTGYSISIKRVSFQRVDAEIEQFCVIAQIRRPAPGQALEQRRTVSNHVVRMARRGFGYAVPAAAILRSPDGKLISKTTSFGPVRPALCKA